MRGLKKRRRIQIIVIAVVLLAGASVMIGYGMRDGINFFRSPSAVAAAPPSETEIFRIGGLVLEGSLQAGEGIEFSFIVTDGGADIPVRYVGTQPPPDLFGEGQGTIATGTFVDGTFLATDLLARHDETYMPIEVIEALEEQGVYRQPQDS
jgi:cytochrome c-type biogenesis protein CcmE